jgi:hypothetical protein
MGTSFKWDAGEVSAVWHRPAGNTSSGLVLGHGASYNMNARFLIDVADALAARGTAVVRFNFPYAEAGRRVPDPQPRLEACFLAVADAVSKEVPKLFLGGKSMGGRIASHVVADGFPARGLVFFGYPLHPPGKPDRLRDAHLRRISAPMLFLQGTRDNFATPGLLRRTVDSLETATLVEIEGGDHSFKVPGRAPADVLAQLIEAAAQFFAEHER